MIPAGTGGLGRAGGAGNASSLLPCAGTRVGADDAVRPVRFFVNICRGRCPHRPFCPDSPDCHFHGNAVTVASQTHFFCLARKSGQKEALGDGAGCTAVPQKYPVEEHCGQHTGISLQSCTTAPPAWRQRSHRKQLPRKGMAKHTAMEFGTHLRIRRWCKFLMERADRGVRPYSMQCVNEIGRVFRK